MFEYYFVLPCYHVDPGDKENTLAQRQALRSMAQE
jgi:hypothetical protein